MRPVTLNLHVLIRNPVNDNPWPGDATTINFNDAACPSVDGDSPSFKVEQGFVVFGEVWTYYTQAQATALIPDWVADELEWHPATKIYCSNNPSNFWVVSESFFDVLAELNNCCGTPSIQTDGFIYNMSGRELDPAGPNAPCGSPASFKALFVKGNGETRNLAISVLVYVYNDGQTIGVADYWPGWYLKPFTATDQLVLNWPQDFIGVTLGGSTIVDNEDVATPPGSYNASTFDNGQVQIQIYITDLDEEETFVNKIEAYKLPGTICDGRVASRMMTFNDEIPTPGYPVGVFNVNGDFISVVGDQAGYIAAWNSNPANSALGTITAGPTPLEFRAPAGAVLRGCRYWEIESTGRCGLFVSALDRVRVNNTTVLGSTGSQLQNFRTFDLFEGMENYRLRNDEFGRVLDIAVTGTQVVRVFHSEGYFAGILSSVVVWATISPNVASTIDSADNRGIQGKLPQNLEQLIICTKEGVNNDELDPGNIENWSELQNIKGFAGYISRFGKTEITGAGHNFDAWLDLIAGQNPEALESLFIFLQQGQPGQTTGDSAGLGRFPNLQFISFEVSAYPFDIAGMGDFPLITGLLYVTHQQYGYDPITSVEVDQMFIDLADRLDGVIPGAPGVIRLQTFSAAATSTSAAARAYLQGQGWIIS